jgi:hypothetical protein
MAGLSGNLTGTVLPDYVASVTQLPWNGRNASGSDLAKAASSKIRWQMNKGPEVLCF